MNQPPVIVSPSSVPLSPASFVTRCSAARESTSGTGRNSAAGDSNTGASALIAQKLQRLRAPGYHRMYTLRRWLAALCLLMAIGVSLVHLQQPTITVSFYATDIVPGQLLEASDIQQRQVPEQGQDTALIVQPEEVIGAMVVHARAAGSQVYAEDVINNQQFPQAHGMHLVPITLAEPSVSDLLVPGDRIHLIPPPQATADANRLLGREEAEAPEQAQQNQAQTALDQLEAVVMVSAQSASATDTTGVHLGRSEQRNPRLAIQEGMIIVAVPAATASVIAGLGAEYSFAVVISQRAEHPGTAAQNTPGN